MQMRLEKQSRVKATLPKALFAFADLITSVFRTGHDLLRRVSYGKPGSLNLAVGVLFWVTLPIQVHSQQGGQRPQYKQPTGKLDSRDGQWEQWSEDRGTLRRRVVNLVPRAEADLALSMRLIPEPFDQIDGNAAIHYLQAMGFLEQHAGLKWKLEFEQQNIQTAITTEKPAESFPPHVWRQMHPKDLPVEEVKNYLHPMNFQVRFLKEAARRKSCDFDRNVKGVINPLLIEIPEVKSMRELSRTQTLRFLLAIAENRVHDAIAILGQQFSMGIHLGQDPLAVSCLIGIACASAGWENSFFLCEHSESPNLYWAIAALPRPLVDLNNALSYEGQTIYQYYKNLQQVGTKPLPQSFWDPLTNQLADLINLDNQFNVTGPNRMLEELGDFGIALSIASAVPQARQYLREIENISDDDLDRLPSTQIYFLAMRRSFDRVRDYYSKWQHVPHWEREKKLKEADQKMVALFAKFHPVELPISLCLPAYRAHMSAQARLDQEIALLQAVEAIRNTLATHNHEFPESLKDLELPVPDDPVTGKPFEYLLHREGATLTSGYCAGVRYQLELRVKSNEN